MLSIKRKAGLALVAVAIVAVQAVGCVGPASSSPGPSTEASATPITDPPTSKPTIPTLPPPPPPPTDSITPTPSDSTDVTPTESTEPPVTTIAPPDGVSPLTAEDSYDDLFDGRGRPVQSESYLDIVGIEVYVAESGLFFRMTLDGALPQASVPGWLLEWDFFIDADMSATTGWAGNIIVNDIGPDYILRLVIAPDQTWAEIHNASTDARSAIAYQIDGNTISFSVPSSILAVKTFNFTAATRAWQDGEPVAMDKIPNDGHYNVPNGHVYIKPGLPTLQFASAHATVWYNEGNEERARQYAEAYEAAYTVVFHALKPPSWPPYATIYVYAYQADLVTGLQRYSGFTKTDAEAYQNGGVPRESTGSIFHIPPDFSWRDIYHQLAIKTMDRLC